MSEEQVKANYFLMEQRKTHSKINSGFFPSWKSDFALSFAYFDITANYMAIQIFRLI